MTKGEARMYMYMSYMNINFIITMVHNKPPYVLPANIYVHVYTCMHAVTKTVNMKVGSNSNPVGQLTLLKAKQSPNMQFHPRGE